MSRKESRIASGRLRSSYVTTIVSISLVLFMLSLLGFLVLNAQRLSNYVKENIGFSVYLNEAAKEVDIISLQKVFDASPYVKSTNYIDKETAAKELQEDLGEDFLDFLGQNPLAPTIDVKLNAVYANPDSISVIEKELMKFDLVTEIFYQKNLVHLVNENIRKISLVIIAFSAVLLIISMALINNTIRLSIYAKRFLIKTMQLVGATHGFIRRPFVFRGVLHGLYSSLIASALLAGVIYLAQEEFSEIFNLYDFQLIGILVFFVILLGMFLSGFSTHLAVTKFLKLRSEDLHY